MYNPEHLLKLLQKTDDVEKTNCNLPMVFAEIFKDEINATEEHVLLNDVKKVLRKHSGDAQKIAAVCEFFKVISGGASLEEILQVSIDETLSPTAVSEIINGNEY